MAIMTYSEPTQTSASILCIFVLLVEGRDEINFFAALLCYMYPGATIEVVEGYTQCIVRNVRPNVDIEIREVGGKDQFPKKLALFLASPDFGQVVAYALVRDADNSAENTLKSIQNLLKKHGQPCPPHHGELAMSDDGAVKVGLFIMPGAPAMSGMLEDLCLASVGNHPIMPYVMAYMDKVRETMGEKAPKNSSKATVLAYLAGMYEYVTSLGLAAQRHYWPFDDGAFGHLRDFLAQFLAEVQP